MSPVAGRGSLRRQVACSDVQSGPDQLGPHVIRQNTRIAAYKCTQRSRNTERDMRIERPWDCLPVLQVAEEGPAAHRACRPCCSPAWACQSWENGVPLCLATIRSTSDSQTSPQLLTLRCDSTALGSRYGDASPAYNEWNAVPSDLADELI